MMRNTYINATELVVVLISALLFSFLLVHSYGLLLGDEMRLLTYLNFLSRDAKNELDGRYIFPLRIIGILGGVSSILFFRSLMVNEAFNSEKKYKILKWAVFAAIITVVGYGGLVRLYSNQQGAANLFFFSSLLYLLFWWLKKESRGADRFSLYNIFLLPLYLLLFYTMGLPGWAKIFGNAQITSRYVDMFRGSIVEGLPGGTPLMIGLLGLLELSVPILLIISLLKREFLEDSSKVWLQIAMVVTILTFTMLSFGLSILFNFAGSSNLVFYSLFSFLILMKISDIKNKNNNSKKRL